MPRRRRWDGRRARHGALLAVLLMAPGACGVATHVRSSPTVRARYDANPSWHLDGVADAAFFDPDQVGKQIGARSTDDGTMHSSAFANLDVRSGEQWFMVQVTGLRAERAGIEHALASVAQQIHDNLRGGDPR